MVDLLLRFPIRLESSLAEDAVFSMSEEFDTWVGFPPLFLTFFLREPVEGWRFLRLCLLPPRGPDELGEFARDDCLFALAVDFVIRGLLLGSNLSCVHGFDIPERDPLCMWSFEVLRLRERDPAFCEDFSVPAPLPTRPVF